MAGTGLAAVLVNTVIARKPPLGGLNLGDDPVANTMAQARTRGRAWMEATPRSRWVLTAHDGVELAGYYFPTTQPAADTAVLIHGHRADASLMGDFARHYRDRGFNVFMADNRGHGESGGAYVGMGWLDHLDYLAWTRRIAATVAADTGRDARIVVHGVSMGAATALIMSGSPDLAEHVRAVISDCSFSSARDELAHHLHARHLPASPTLAITDRLCLRMAGYRLTRASPQQAITGARTPILLIHGSADTYNPTWMGRRLHQAHPAAWLWIAPGAEHGMSYYTDPDTYLHQIDQFLTALTALQPDDSHPGP
ncbi:alpha/beta hydrolase [Nocardia sp. NPDC052112]|uniref:alpha/beta hydrolase n=1 Tax=Nocardia sp. NPDC052112 TaxID=3155646 RepID=UPI003416BA0F